MNVSFINSKDVDLKEKISKCLQSSTEFDWAVAFGQYSAFKELEDDFSSFFKKGGRSRAVFDLSSGITDPLLIEELVTYPGESFCKVYCGDGIRSGIFHHKFYIFRALDDANVLIGSANFSSTAFHKNYESCAFFEGCTDESFFREITEYFERELWDSPAMISPESDVSILNIYSDLYHQQTRGKRLRQETLNKLENTLAEIADNQINQKKLNTQIAYLLGIICSSAYSLRMEDINEGKLKIRFKSALKNAYGADEMDKGYICARVDGNLLGDVRLPQRETQVKTFSRIVKELKVFLSWDRRENEITFSDESRRQTNFLIEVRFHKNSKVWKILRNHIAEFRMIGGRLHPIIPNDILNAEDPSTAQHFLKGYFDFRSRISKSDRYPGTHGRLRVAIQIGTNDLPFAEQLCTVLNDRFNVSTQLVDGSTRGKDNMIRMVPTKDILKFWTAGYEKILINSFIEYNAGL